MERRPVNVFSKLGVAAFSAAVIAGCGAAAASTPPRPKAATVKAKPAATKPRGAAARIDRLTALAKEHYTGEVSGQHSIQTLHSVGSDPVLLRLLGSRDLTAARAYINHEYWGVWYHWHVSRMRIVQGSHVVSELGVPFVIPASHMTLRGSGGRNLGTLYVSMQDEIGVVRLLHRLYPIQVVIRGDKTKRLRTSMYSAAFVKLPTSGSVRLSGHRYLVRSFREPAWGGETVTIWILMKG
jgi:hypothetical protein